MNKLTLILSAALISAAACGDEIKANDEYPEFYNGDATKGIDFVQSIKVLAPRYCSNVKGDVTVVFEAKGMTRVLARCWSGEGDGWGTDTVLADVKLDARARSTSAGSATDATWRRRARRAPTATSPTAWSSSAASPSRTSPSASSAAAARARPLSAASSSCRRSRKTYGEVGASPCGRWWKRRESLG